MTERRKSAREVEYTCLECGLETLAWPGDLVTEARLTGDEAAEDAARYLRCRKCGGQVRVSHDQRDEFSPDEMDMKGKALIINRGQYSAVVKVPGKVVIACGVVNVVLEGDDEELARIALGLSRSLELDSNGATVLHLPDKVAVFLS